MYGESGKCEMFMSHPYLFPSEEIHTPTIHCPISLQEEIHTLLLAFAEAGATVIRLKGGDPYVYGRGGEEVRGKGGDRREEKGLRHGLFVNDEVFTLCGLLFPLHTV